MNKKILGVGAGFLALVAVLSGCSTPADTTSYNLSQEAENFELQRRIVFINGITDKYLLTIEGRCNIETGDSMASGTLEVTCKVGDDAYKKHFLGLSDNVTFIVEQTDAADVSSYNYKLFFRPETILPDIDLQVSSTDTD